MCENLFLHHIFSDLDIVCVLELYETDLNKTILPCRKNEVHLCLKSQTYHFHIRNKAMAVLL